MRLAKLLCYYSSMNAFKLVFSAKAYFKVGVISVKKSGNHSSPCQSLLLSTTIPNGH